MVITNTMRCLVTRLSCMHSGVVFADSGEVLWYVAANARGFDGSDSPHCWIGGFLYVVSCILIPITASTPLILSKSRMRRRARTDLCGGRSAMVVPTATNDQGPGCVALTAMIGSSRETPVTSGSPRVGRPRELLKWTRLLGTDVAGPSRSTAISGAIGVCQY
jgi:hypothetical protein